MEGNLKVACILMSVLVPNDYLSGRDVLGWLSDFRPAPVPMEVTCAA